MSRKPLGFDKKCVKAARLVNQESVQSFLLAASYPDGSHVTTLADRSGEESRFYQGVAEVIEQYSESTGQDIDDVTERIMTRVTDGHSEDSGRQESQTSEGDERSVKRREEATNSGGDD